MEEYKDASLKTQKKLHFIGTIRHICPISTSKSQQFAFEVVMKEKTPLLFACDNKILMEEWITAFDEVMTSMVADHDDECQIAMQSPAVIKYPTLDKRERNLQGT